MITIANFSLTNSFSNFSKNIYQFLYKHTISFNKLFTFEKIKIKENLHEDWKVNIIKELINIDDFFFKLVLIRLELHVDHLCTE